MADRTTQVITEIEYVGIHKDRSTQVILMIEYVPKPTSLGRIYGPAVQ